MFLIRAVALSIGVLVASQQSSALKIVVIQGEDAVNIIQQKTAVAPIVEVRDRNDLPVAGASVTFVIKGSTATFGPGLQTVTITTNAAGRAAVASLNPLGSGAVQINVTASFQGQTAAATITQTNVMTAAQATAGTAAATAGAGAGAAGGGLSGAAIAGIAGGAGAGALVAVRAAGGGDSGGGGGGGTGSGGGGGGGGGGGSQACAFTVSPTSLTAEADGGMRTISVAVQPTGCTPQGWTATSPADWVTLNASGGTGSGSVTATIAANPPLAPPRSHNLQIAGQPVSVAQSQGCQFIVAPTSVTLPGAGGSAAVTVQPSPSGCIPSPWTTMPAQFSNFITLSPTSGVGGGVVTVTVTPNPNPFAGRSDAVVIAGYAVSVSQGPGM